MLPNPLLAPLIPEGVAGANPAYHNVEIAAEHPPTGHFYSPQGTEYVSIAYVPLQSEATSRA